MKRVVLATVLLSLCIGAVQGQLVPTDQPSGSVELRSVRAGKTQDLVFDPRLRPFYHGVASGDPLTDRVIIWTRVTPETEGPVQVRWKVATDPRLANVVRSGQVETSANRDYTVKVDVDGLEAGRVYYYGFEALGAASLTGRTRTLPTTDPDHLRFAVVSCNNYEAGYYNAFSRIAERNDLDAVIHLGDYIYEYEPGRYGSNQVDRPHEPKKEVISLEDYRTRYSLYRLDTSLMRAHQQQVFINIWDDHESANDSWMGGAQNHQPDTEGPWNERLQNSKQAYFEWIPIRDNAQRQIYRRFSFGRLADLIMLDTRIEGRTEQPTDIRAAEFEADGPERALLGRTQEQWFLDALAQSQARWKLIGNQVIFSELNVGFANPANPDSVENIFLDIWDGYPAERRRVMNFIRSQNIDNVVFLSGDFHCAFGFDVVTEVLRPGSYDPETGAGSVAVEFATPSITSANFDENLPAPLAQQFNFLINNPIPGLGINFNPHMKYTNLLQHGYLILDLKDDGNGERVQADWIFVPSILELTNEQAVAASWQSRARSQRLTQAAAPSTPKTRQDTPAPLDPPIITGRKAAADEAALLLSYGPNPLADELALNVALNRGGTLRIQLFDAQGRLVRTWLDNPQAGSGFYRGRFATADLPAGSYVLRIDAAGQVISRKLAKF